MPCLWIYTTTTKSLLLAGSSARACCMSPSSLSTLAFKGEHARWGLLGEQVRVYGFDAISEALDRITAAGVRPHRVFRAIAIGNEDGEREFFVPPNTTAASFYERVTLHQTARHGDGAP